MPQSVGDPSKGRLRLVGRSSGFPAAVAATDGGCAASLFGGGGGGRLKVGGGEAVPWAVPSLLRGARGTWLT